MSSVSIPQLAAWIRREVQSLATHAAARPAASTAPRPVVRGPAQRRPSRQSANREDLASTIARRVAALDRTDRDGARRQAVRIFLEAVLLAELDATLMNDPAFFNLLDEVESQLHARPEWERSVIAAADALLDGSGPAPGVPTSSPSNAR